MLYMMQCHRCLLRERSVCNGNHICSSLFSRHSVSLRPPRFLCRLTTKHVTLVQDHCAVTTATRLLHVSGRALFSTPRTQKHSRTLSLRSLTAMAVGNDLRPVQLVVPGTHVSDGAGMPICRSVGTPALRNLDPYLMLDELKAPAHLATAGFPDHPHRGFETCSIMLEGKMEHQDSVGNKGVIGPGGVQWMTAGRGIVHSEMPKVTEGNLWGFQLWINLPKKDKMVKPRYQDYQASDIPIVQEGGVTVRVMAGSHRGSTGPIDMRNPGLLMDVSLTKGSTFKQEVPRGWNGFAYVCVGSGRICGTQGSCQQALVFGPGDHVTATTNDEQGLRFLLVAGQPIGEPVVQYGPFVMNTEAEIHQAFADYQSGRLQSDQVC